jgi:hypothetical protein
MKSEKFRYITSEVAKLLFSALIGCGFAYFTFSKQFDATEKARLNDGLNKILDINMEYPFLVDSNFVTRWNKDKTSTKDSSIRYQTYCDYVFNFLQDVCDYYGYNKKKIDNFLDVADLIGLQKEWWNLPEQRDSDTFPEEFRDFVNGYYNLHK